MNREEIEKMVAGKAINEMVAEKVMKWYKVGGDWFSARGMEEYCEDFGGCEEDPVGYKAWSPSTDWVAAGRVIEKIKNLGKKEQSTHDGKEWFEMQHRFLLSWIPAQQGEVGFWECGFYDFRYDNWQSIEIAADKAPLAICRAALLMTL
jgi:hypothetical protein